MTKEKEEHPNFHEASLVGRPFMLYFSEHDLRHLRSILKHRAIESTDWATVRCAVGIYERINEQLTEGQKNLLSGLPGPARERKEKRREESGRVLTSTPPPPPPPKQQAGEPFRKGG